MLTHPLTSARGHSQGPRPPRRPTGAQDEDRCPGCGQLDGACPACVSRFEGASTMDYSAPQSDDEARVNRRIFPRGAVLDGVYAVGAVLGKGAMGQVFDGRDLRLGREVAIKACFPDYSGTYIHAEGEMLASFRHPGIVTVHAMGSHQGVDFLVMERLYGLTLREHIVRRGTEAPFAVEEALEILISVCDALAVIHRAGILHRDLKPSNIMLAPGGRAVLLDLGVSIRNDEWERTRGMAGSPPYMAPESIASDTESHGGHLVDIYALGCLAFELLTGRLPFSGARAEAILTQHLHRERPRVSTHVNVPAPLDRLIGEMMKRDPTQRPQSAEVVGAWLRGIRRGQREPAGTAPLSVVIADDDPDMRAVLASFVEQTVPAADIRQVTDGEQALREIRRFPPDLALLDLDMPRLSGVDLCMILRGTSRAAQTALAAISGAATESDRRLLDELGVAAFISKDENAGALLSRVRGLLLDMARTRSRVLATGVAVEPAGPRASP